MIPHRTRERHTNNRRAAAAAVLMMIHWGLVYLAINIIDPILTCVKIVCERALLLL